MARRTSPEGATERRRQTALRLRQLRTVLESNQAEVARTVGVPPDTWNRYERGGRDLDAYALAAFCRAYRVSADWVLLGELESLPKPVLIRMVALFPELAKPDPPAPGQAGGPPAPSLDIGAPTRTGAPPRPLPRRARSLAQA